MGALESPRKKSEWYEIRKLKTLDRYELGDFGLVCVTIFLNIYTYRKL